MVLLHQELVGSCCKKKQCSCCWRSLQRKKPLTLSLLFLWCHWHCFVCFVAPTELENSVRQSSLCSWTPLSAMFVVGMESTECFAGRAWSPASQPLRLRLWPAMQAQNLLINLSSSITHMCTISNYGVWNGPVVKLITLGLVAASKRSTSWKWTHLSTFLLV
jgi:hypothetical protein